MHSKCFFFVDERNSCNMFDMIKCLQDKKALNELQSALPPKQVLRYVMEDFSYFKGNRGIQINMTENLSFAVILLKTISLPYEEKVTLSFSSSSDDQYAISQLLVDDVTSIKEKQREREMWMWAYKSSISLLVQAL